MLASLASKADILSIIDSRAAPELSGGGTQEFFPEVLADLLASGVTFVGTGCGRLVIQEKLQSLQPMVCSSKL